MSNGQYEYRKAYKIYRVSEDGLLKHPHKYDYDSLNIYDVSYETEEAAMDDIVKYDLGVCLVIPVVERQWIWEENG
jgi:hypothetical protein